MTVIVVEWAAGVLFSKKERESEIRSAASFLAKGQTDFDRNPRTTYSYILGMYVP